MLWAFVVFTRAGQLQRVTANNLAEPAAPELRARGRHLLGTDEGT
jgi:hypothetical protein